MSLISLYKAICDPRPLESPSAIVAGAAGSFFVTDVDHLAAVFPSWELKLVQVDCGPFRASTGCAQFPGLLVRWVQTDRKMQVRGIPRGSKYVLTLITEANACWRFRGGR